MLKQLIFAPESSAGTQLSPPNGTKDLPTLQTGSKNKFWSARARLARFLFALFPRKMLLSVRGEKSHRGLGT